MGGKDIIKIPVETLSAEEAIKILKELGVSIDTVKDKVKTKLKINADTADIEKFNKAMAKIETAGQKNKNVYNHGKYYKSEENALISLNKAWNAYAKSRNEGKIGSDLIDGSIVTDVLRYANAYEALGGSLKTVSPQLEKFVSTLRNVDKYSSKNGYGFTVDAFKQSFNIFKDFEDAGAYFEKGFEPAKKEALDFLEVTDKILVNVERIKNNSSTVNTKKNGNVDNIGNSNADENLNNELLEAKQNANELEKELKDISGISITSEDILQLLEILKEISLSIKEVSIAFGQIDDKEGTSSLLQSLKNIKSEVSELSTALNGMNFNVALNVSGKSASERASQLRSVTSGAVDEIIKAYNALNDMLAPSGKETDLFRGQNDKLIRFMNILDGMQSDDSVQKQYDDYTRLISILKELANLKGINVSSWSDEFEKPLQDSMETVEKVRSGADEIENTFKNLFGHANNITLEGLTLEIDKIVEKLQEMINLFQSVFSTKIDVDTDGVNAEFINLLNVLTEIKEAIVSINGLKVDTKVKQGKVAEGETHADNPKDAQKGKGKNPKKKDSSMSKESLYKRTDDIEDAVKKVADSTDGVVSSVTKFKDSEDNLVKAQIKTKETLDDAVKTTTTTINYDEENGLYSSDIDSYDYEAVRKQREKQYRDIKKASEAKKTAEINLRNSEINSLLKEQKSEYEAIYRTRLDIAKLDKNSADYSINKEQLELEVKKHQESYLSIQKKLNSYGEIELRQKHINELLEIGQRYQDSLYKVRKSDMNTNLEAQIKTQNKIYELESKIATTTKSSAVAGYESDLQAERRKLKLLKEESEQYADILSKEEQEKYVIEKTNDALNKKNKIIDANNNNSSKTKQVKNASTVSINAQISKTANELEQLRYIGHTDIFSNMFQEAETEVEGLNAKLKESGITLTEYRNKVSVIKKNLKDNKDIFATIEPDNLQQAKQEMQEYAHVLSDGKAVLTDANTIGDKVTYTWTEQDGVVHKLKLSYNKLNGALSEVHTHQRQTEKHNKTLWESFKQGWQNVRQYVMSFVGFYEIINIIRTGIGYIKELDTALTEMRKVSDETENSLRRFQDASFDMAASIGTTAVEIQKSSADFMRLGYSLKEASELAQDANIYANVGDMEIDEATEHMVSSIKAWGSEFNSEVEASGAIVDRYNEIGNNFAITSADIGSAMERSAAALKAGGNTLNESLGLITAGNLIQQDADTTANALKVMSLRIRGSKTDLEEMGEETDGLASSTSKLREEIKALTGVDIMADENTYKSTAEIIQEIGAVWDKLTDVSKASALEKLAGKTRASTVAGLLENYETIDEVIKSAENADGSAIEENLRYMESIEGKVNEFTNKIQEFWHNLIGSDVVKEVVDAGTSLINIFDNMLSGISDSEAINLIVDLFSGLITLVETLTNGLGKLNTVFAGTIGFFAYKKIKGNNSGGRVKKFTLISNMPPNRLAERCAR